MSKEYRIVIEGMGCAHCVKSVSEALTAIGANVEDVTIGEARITFSGDISMISDAVESRGFDVRSISEVQ